MSLSLRISNRAASEIERAERWWLENRPAAPNALREDLLGVFRLLLQRPGVGVSVANTKLSGVRRLTLGRVKYYVYYHIRESELVVLALWHTSRRPPKL
jgi:plasmid stabilization system protein ParE